MARKTFAVEELRAAANRMLAAPAAADTPEDRAARLAVCGLVEHVLFATGNYKGWKHLESEWDAEAWALRDGHDDTRRQYL